MNLTELVRLWYRGSYLPPPQNDPTSDLLFLLTGHHEQPALAKTPAAVGRFCLENWKWIIATAVAAALGFAKLR